MFAKAEFTNPIPQKIRRTKKYCGIPQKKGHEFRNIFKFCGTTPQIIPTHVFFRPVKYFVESRFRFRKSTSTSNSTNKIRTFFVKGAFDEFKIRWIPPVPLVYPQPAGFLFLGAFADEKKSSGSASIDASRLIFQSAVSFSNPLGSLSNPLGCDNIFETSPDIICQCASHIYQHRS